MLYKGCKTTYDFTKFKIIRSFGDAIENGIVMMDMAKDEQRQVAKKITESQQKTKLKNLNMKKEKESVQNSALVLLKASEMVYNTFKNGIFSVPSKKLDESKESVNHFH